MSEPNRPLTENEILMNQFDDCVNFKVDLNYVEVSCKLGLWSVQGVNVSTLTKEALHYWQQYKDDGEYSSIIVGKNVYDTLIAKGV